MNNLIMFENKSFGSVRGIEIKGKAYFVGSDIAKALGYAIPSKAINTHCKGVSKMEVPSNGGSQEMLIIQEGDVYRLIMKSKLPAAEKFESWVMDEVLPQIRQTGGYIPIVEEDDAETIMAKALMVAQKTLDKKDSLLKEKDIVIAAQNQVIECKEIELGSKNRFINQIAVSENSLLVREVSKVASKNGITIGERTLWKKLREWGLIFKNTTEPKQVGINRGYFEVVQGSRQNNKGVFTYQTTRITGKGQVYIIERLLKENKEIA